MGQYNQAELFYIEVKQIREKVIGKESIDYAQVCNNLGILYTDMGQYSKAEPFYLEAKQIRRKQFGKESTKYADACNNLGTFFITLSGNMTKQN